jgi:hypothetical protein
MSIEAQAQRMLALFDPGRHAYGVLSAVGIPGKDGKLDKKQFTKTAELTHALVEKHLRDASKTVGFIPHKTDTTCRFGVADCDEYEKDIGPELARKFAGTPLFVARSPSGGSHVYRISDKDVSAEEMRAYFQVVIKNDLSAQEGFDCVIPKVDDVRISKGGIGNYINAPLAGILGPRPLNEDEIDHRFDRCVYNDDGDPITDLDVALDFIESKIAPLESPRRKSKPTKKKTKKYRGDIDDLSVDRNAKLLSLGGTYLNAGMSFEQVKPMIELLFWQEQKNRPGESERDGQKEIEGILDWLQNKESEATGFSNLVRWSPKVVIDKSDVFFTLDYNGETIRLDSFSQLKNSEAIRDAVAEQLGKLPALTRRQWATNLERLFETKENKEHKDSTANTIAFALWSVLNRDVRLSSEYAQPWNAMRLKSGHYCWIDLEAGRVWFPPVPMVAELNKTALGFKINSRKLAEVVRSMGGGTKPKRARKIETYKEGNVWKQRDDGTTEPIYMHWLPMPAETIVEYRESFDMSDCTPSWEANYPALVEDVEVAQGGEGYDGGNRILEKAHDTKVALPNTRKDDEEIVEKMRVAVQATIDKSGPSF